MIRTSGLLALALLLGACAPSTLLLNGAADRLAAQGTGDEEDPGLARDAAAFSLKLSESVLQQTPGHLRLAESVAGGFTGYAWAFLAFEADRAEARDVQAAQQLRQRAARMTARAQRHAMAALEHRQPGFARALARGQPLPLHDDEVGVAHWAATAWGAWISLSKDQPDVVADLPLAARLARLAYERDPGHAQGALASLMGSFEAARPGGSLQRAEGYFDRAIVLSRGSVAAYVAKAEGHALAGGDRSAFEQLLQQALKAQPQARDLTAQVMRERARWLLQTLDDRF